MCTLKLPARLYTLEKMLLMWSFVHCVEFKVHGESFEF